MHGPTLARLILAVSILGAGGAAPSSISEQIAAARRYIASQQPTTAISTLEQALGNPDLAGNPADKATIIGLLRDSYEAAAAQADADGKTRIATGYRENGRILARSSTGTGTATSPSRAAAVVVESATPHGARVSPVADAPSEAPRSVPELTTPTGPLAVLTEPIEPAATARPALASNMAATDRIADSNPMPTPEPEPAPSGPGLAEADAAFRAKKYAEAGQIYANLARDQQLPADRIEHWAYCRSSVVARRIAANPRTEAEWQSIDAEIDQIRALAPTNWLGEYLRNRASARTSARKVSKPGATVVRAASPEESPTPADRPSRNQPLSPSQGHPASDLGNPNSVRVDTPMLTEPGASPGGPIGRWRVRESDNFRVFHANPELAEQVVRVAETVRREGIKRWTGRLPKEVWKPRCEIYLFPNAAQYAQVTGQPLDSPGFSTMGMNQGQIIGRRVNVRTDHEGLLSAVLPHEITHVILADFFTDQQIPRWADEGMAVLMEPAHEQKKRATDLVDPLGRNLLFPIETLMKMDYPDERYWTLYYAQSVSLTRFFVEQGTPAQFIQFLQGAQTRGLEAEMKRTYKIENFADLQARWVTYARANINADAPSAATASASNETRSGTRTR